MCEKIEICLKDFLKVSPLTIERNLMIDKVVKYLRPSYPSHLHPFDPA